jgi:hypothetical protein
MKPQAYTQTLAALMNDPHADPMVIKFLLVIEAAILEFGVDKFALSLVSEKYLIAARNQIALPQAA